MAACTRRSCDNKCNSPGEAKQESVWPPSTGEPMSLPEPYPDLNELLATIGEAGVRLSGIEASEGAAGNISIYIGWPIEVRRLFPLAEQIELPQPAPALAGKVVIVTGSGRRLRDIRTDPAANLSAIIISQD